MKPQELHIYEACNKNIFNSDDKYVIPLYQRAYAWADKEINQLVDDVNDNERDNYYIGTLVVYKRADAFEVIDGQQRLTTLFLLLIYLGADVRNNLIFDCRQNSNLTLANFSEKGHKKKLDEVEEEESLKAGLEIIEEKFITDKIDKESFKEKLSHVILYRIEVPECTDLNRYFEIMNTRGEQLEQHDVVKANMMALIEDSNIRNCFAKIWEACSDMTGYVQMNMSKDLRENLFGNKNWNEYPKSYDFLRNLADNKPKEEATADTDSETILDGILSSNHESLKIPMPEVGDKVRFDSAISFTYFLLHVLRIFVDKEKINRFKLPKLLEDINLLSEYKSLLAGVEHGDILPLKFIDCLLKCRYLYDNYIIKREYSEDDKEGKWSLKSLNKSKDDGAYFTETFEKSKSKELMLQAAMRVSFTSPKIMHWITESLQWLYELDRSPQNNEFELKLKAIINKSVIENLFNQDNYERMGVQTPHIAFNYLDYLLWEDNTNYDYFDFEYRTSVEHWFPQHPSSGSFTPWKEDEYNHFGNLCIIQRNINSKFSNLEPHSKKASYCKEEEELKKKSLKLRIMADKTVVGTEWKDIYESHGEEMLNKLAEACNYKRNNSN